MSETTPFDLSQLFSDLTGRRVAVAVGTPSTAPAKQILGVYNVLPEDHTILLKVDLALMGSLGGVLMGMPDTVVKQLVAESTLDDGLRDAMHEVLNIASSAVTHEGRAVLKWMETDTARATGMYADMARLPHHKNHFQATIQGYQGGGISILTQI